MHGLIAYATVNLEGKALKKTFCFMSPVSPATLSETYISLGQEED